MLHYMTETKSMSIQNLQALFDKAHEFKLRNMDVACTLPFLEDCNGNTPLDLALLDDDNADINLGNCMLSNIKDYPYLHSGPLLVTGVIRAFKYGVPVLGDFLDSRLVRSPHLHCSSLSRKAIK